MPHLFVLWYGCGGCWVNNLWLTSISNVNNPLQVLAKYTAGFLSHHGYYGMVCTWTHHSYGAGFHDLWYPVPNPRKDHLKVIECWFSHFLATLLGDIGSIGIAWILKDYSFNKLCSCVKNCLILVYGSVIPVSIWINWTTVFSIHFKYETWLQI